MLEVINHALLYIYIKNNCDRKTIWNGTEDGMKSNGMELKKEDNPPLNAGNQMAPCMDKIL